MFPWHSQRAIGQSFRTVDVKNVFKLASSSSTYIFFHVTLSHYDKKTTKKHLFPTKTEGRVHAENALNKFAMPPA